MQSEKYVLHSSSELGRLHINHQVYKQAAQNRLIWAPVDFSDGPKAILDVAGADGFWARDVVRDLPVKDGITAVTTDIMEAYFPAELDQNFEHVKHDTNAPFPAEWEKRFDLVHQRLGYGGIGANSLAVTKEFFRITKPGGWVQLVEMVIDEDRASGSASAEFFLVLQAVFARGGQDPLFATKNVHVWASEAGFVDVQETLIPCSFGRLNPGPDLAKASAEGNSIAVQQLVQFVKSFGEKPPLLAEVDLDTLGERYSEELSTQGATYKMRVVWGQRPL